METTIVETITKIAVMFEKVATSVSWVLFVVLAINAIRSRRVATTDSPSSTVKTSANHGIHRSLLSRPWVVAFFVLASMMYVLPTVLLPGELTKWSVYNICIGIGLFFFILIHSSISQLTDMFIAMKTVDLEFRKANLDLEKAKASFLTRSK